MINLFPKNISKFISTGLVLGSTSIFLGSNAFNFANNNLNISPILNDDTIKNTQATQFYQNLTSKSQNQPSSLPLVPIIYSDRYNLEFYGIERYHPFDSCKYRKVINELNRHISKSDTPTPLPSFRYIEPEMLQREHLEEIHTEKYLNSLKDCATVGSILEIPFIRYLPNMFIQSYILNPLLLASSGSVLGGKIALDKGFAFNIGGGFHHSSSEQGSGFCPFADISICIKFLFKHFPDKVKKVMIIDLDAHAGNGHERDKVLLNTKEHQVFIFDIFNGEVFPNDEFAEKQIDVAVKLKSGTNTEEYLTALEANLAKSLNKFKPDFVVYNAGSDILEGDPLGRLSVSIEGIIKRDELVFQEVFQKRNTPILMLLSGGYQNSNGKIIADSIYNLKTKFKLF